MESMPKYPTIRQEAKIYGLVSEHHLRLMLAQGRLPGFYTGKVFRVNHDRLVEVLDGMTPEGTRQ